MMDTGHPPWNGSDHEIGHVRYCSNFILSIGLLGLALVSTAYAKDTASEHQETSTRFTSSASLLTDNQRAKLWGLDISEWQEYKRLMQGPRGLWTPNLDPVQVLGMNAKTPAEMQKYAKKMAKMEYDRLTREGAFDKAYSHAYQKLLNGAVLFPINKAAKENKKDSNQTPVFWNKRIQFYVKLPCDDECLPQMKTWLDDGVNLDIFFLDSKNAAIKSWAVKMGISPLLVTSKQVTLNHITKAQADALGVTTFPSWRKK